MEISANRLAKAKRNVFLESPLKYRWITELAMDDLPLSALETLSLMPIFPL